MTCQRYTAALINLAASAAEPTAELRAHVQDCPSCRVTFQRERQLFASIDKSLRDSANTEVPPAFVQRVRAAANQQPSPDRISFARPRWVFALAAAAVILFFIAHFARQQKLGAPENSTARRQSPSEVRTPYPPAHTPAAVSPLATVSIVQSNRSAVSTAKFPRASLNGHRDPDILVPGDQEILLARYARQSRLHDSLPVIANNVEPSQMPELQVAPIQIAQLDVKPLEERQE